MSQFRQDNRFTGKMSGDINDLNAPARTYKKAVNMFSRDYGNLTSLTREQSDLFVNWDLFPGDEPASYSWVAAFRVPVRDPNDGGIEREWIIAFMDLGVDGGAIYQIDPQNATRIYRLHDDRQAPAAYDRNDLLVFDKDMDVTTYREGEETYVFWTSKGSGPRCIIMVSDQSSLTQHDVSIVVGDFLGTADVADSLYIQPLVTNDRVRIDELIEDGGALPCGTYQYAYRYVNSKSGKVSRISPLSDIVSVLPDYSTTNQLNNIVGGGPGQTSNIGIQVAIVNGDGYHRAMFDRVQWFQVFWTGNSEAIVSATGLEEIDANWYQETAPFPGLLKRLFTGSENLSVFTMDEVLEVTANIEEAVVLEEKDGRLYLGNITYTDLESGMNWQNDVNDVLKAFTRFETEDYTSIDLMDGTVSDHCSDPALQVKGYRGGEVYRFGITYWDKFGNYSKPDRFKFTATRRTTANHSSGGASNNWADPACTDWKFPERSYQLTGITRGLNSLGSWSLELAIEELPDWAFGFHVVRKRRKKNIIAQTPIIHAMSINGSYSHADPETADDVTIFERPWAAQGNYDTSGVNDTYEPKVLSYGGLKNIDINWHPGTANAKKRLFYPIVKSAKQKDWAGTDIFTDGTRNSLLYLYPLEYLANDNGEPFSTEDLEGAYIELIDCVTCTAYNAARSGEVRDVLTGANVVQGAAAKYVWIFAPEDGEKYWSYNNSGLFGFTERGSNQYDAGVPVGPERVKIGSAWTIPYGSLPTTIGEGHSDDEGVSQISKANGLADLWASQADNTIGVFKNADYRYPGPIVNQRAILVSQVPTNDTIPVIQDPVYFIYENYQTGLGNYELFTGSTAPAGTPTISTNAVTDSTDPADPSSISSLENPFMIEPSSGLPVLIANITRGLDDFRYSDNDDKEEWISTNAYQSIPKGLLDILNATAFTVPIQVYGGDTLITRALIKIRDNAPIINTAEVSDEQDASANRKFLQYQGAYGDTVAVNGDQVARVTGYETYVEYLSLWVESEVNGFWFARPADSFPSDITGRDLLREPDPATYPDFLHDDQIISKSLAPITYLYNFAYSREESPQTWFSGLSFEKDLLNPFSRIHYTPQRVYEEWTFPFQRWLTGDYHDLPRSSGPITRLVNAGNDRMVALQTDDVQRLFLGISVAEDNDGTAFTLQSAQVVGSDASMVGESSKFVTAGAYVPGESIMTPFGLFFFDRRRRQVFQVGQNVTPISDNFVQQIIEDDFIATADTDNSSQYRPRMFYEHTKRRLWLTNFNATADEFRAVCYNCAEQRWETVVLIETAQTAREVYSMVNTESGTTVFADDGGLGQIFDKNKGADFGGMFGSTVESSVTFILNNTEHSAMAKVLKTVQVQGDTAPASVQAVVRRLDIAEQDSGPVLLGKERRGTFLFSNFRDGASPGTRIRGEQIEITITYSGTEEASLESVQTTYRLDHRSKLR